MERLTERHGDGVRYTKGEYEITCYPKNNNLSDIDKMAVKLCELEDKLESGQLVELPCKVGDTVFVLRNGAGSTLHIEEDKIIGFDILQNTIIAHGRYGHAYSEVFLSKAQAEARLKELQEKS